MSTLLRVENNKKKKMNRNAIYLLCLLELCFFRSQNKIDSRIVNFWLFCVDCRIYLFIFLKTFYMCLFWRDNSENINLNSHHQLPMSFFSYFQFFSYFSFVNIKKNQKKLNQIKNKKTIQCARGRETYHQDEGDHILSFYFQMEPFNHFNKEPIGLFFK